MKISLQNYWNWAYSDLLSNTNRAVFAEYLIHEALEIQSEKRIEWDNVDVRYQEKKIEVKASAYLQSWSQKSLSKIQFDIAPRKVSWDSSSNITTSSKGRESDIYIFCLLEIFDKNLATASHIQNMDNWGFYVVPTALLNTVFQNQKSLSLNKLKSIAKRLHFSEVKYTVDSL